ncbi:hypothetical protein CEP54_003913 [Fusarium duplospermum]|uniref:Uncharacterized protein n=1 Tax=Fusarium duplospermum TaxID=1325734 RepID=A0A428QL96_9HYPO|nr:hypothetical protein CEP54_003913 [Fusarium duplospermum]
MYGPRLQIHPHISPYDFEADTSSQKQHQVLHQPESSNKLPYSATPKHVNCCVCYEPGDTSNLIYGTETPTDVIFNISAEESSGLPANSGIYPSKVTDGSRGVLEIPGTGNQPILPTVEDLNPSKWWSYSPKLATSSLYSFIPEALPNEGDHVPIETEKLVILIIKITPRFKGLTPPQTTAFKTSFILRGVTFLLPKSDPSADERVVPSRNARFDLMWQPSSPGGHTSVRTTQPTIRPAIIATFEEDEINFDLKDQTLTLVFILSRLPPLGAQARLVVTQQGIDKPFKRTLELPSDPDHGPDGRGYRYSFKTEIPFNGFKYFIPQEMRLAIVDPDIGRILGPDSAPFVFPQVPRREELRGSCSFYWGHDRHVSVIWSPLNPVHVTVTRKFAFISRLQGSSKPDTLYVVSEDKEGIVRVWEPELKHYGSESLGLTIKVTITIEHSRIQGTVAEWVAELTTMPTVDENKMSVTTSLKAPGPAPPRDNRRLAGIQWCASEGTANEEAGPNIPESKPDLTGAGALAVVQMHQNRRFAIIWIGNDGSVNLWSRNDEGMGPENRDYGIIAPPGSASTLGGGCLAACGEVSIKEPLPRRNPVIWWLGPRGEIFGRRVILETGQWIDVGEGASAPAGSVDISPSLTRPAQMATAWMYDSRKEDEAAYLFWVKSNGDIMGTCSYTPTRQTDPRVSKTAVAYRNVGAAPGTSLTAFIGNGTSPMDARPYLLWVSADGSLCLGSARDFNWMFYGSSWEPIIKISEPGCANPLSDLCLLGHSSSIAAAVVWVNNDRKLQLAWTKSIAGPWGRNEWPPWGWKELEL